MNSSKQVILQRCSDFLKGEKLDTHKIFLHHLSRRRVRDQRLKVFTTNYDLCFERAASDVGGVALDGFSFTAPRRYDPRYFGYDIIRRPRGGDDLGNYLEGVFLLYKLHGSVNWARGSDGTISEKTGPTPEEACLIYLVTGKYQQSYTQPHLEAIAQYLAALREPNTCVFVVGFGFNDDHLSEPLLAAARSNPHLRLIIADAGAQEKAKADADRRVKGHRPFHARIPEASGRVRPAARRVDQDPAGLVGSRRQARAQSFLDERRAGTRNTHSDRRLDAPAGHTFGTTSILCQSSRSKGVAAMRPRSSRLRRLVTAVDHEKSGRSDELHHGFSFGAGGFVPAISP